MNTSKLLLIGTLLVALFMAMPAIAFVPTFTGNAEADFPEGQEGVLVIRDPGTFNTDPPLAQPPEGQDIGVVGQPGDPPGFEPGSGWDIKDIRLAYDPPPADVLYVGLNCWNIVGDADGDGDPGDTTWGGGTDVASLGDSESVCVYFDLDMDAYPAFDNTQQWDVIIGVSNEGPFPQFYKIAVFEKGSFSPPSDFGTEIPGHYGIIPTDPSGAWPDWEFSITSFSTLALDASIADPLQGIKADEVLGAFRVGAFMGSQDDGSIGEDYIFYRQTPSTVVSITPSATAIIEGGTVNLTITEENDSPLALRSQKSGPTDPCAADVELPFYNAEVEVMQDGVPLPWSPLGSPSDIDDIANPGVLDRGEIWGWTRLSNAISATTNFIARGSGVGPAGFVHTYLADSDEQAEVPVALLSTDVSISALPTAVSIGGTVDLTVSETNDGDEDLTNVSVAVTYSTGGPPTPLVILSAPPTSGDVGNDGILGVGETWVWDATTVPALDDFLITTITTFIAKGSGEFDGVIVTYPEDQDEQDQVIVVPLSTDVGISTEPPGPVTPGSTVDLEVTEENDGGAPLTNVSVAVTYSTGGPPIPLVILTAPPTSGDVGNDGILGVGEIWVWNSTTVPALDDFPITATTTFTATGSAEFDGIIVTYPDDPDEQDSVTVEFVNPDTVLDIKANGDDGPIIVCEGDPVTLRICELNNGEVDIYNVEVAVFYDEGSGPVLLTTLMAPPDTGDVSDPGVLNIGEEWCWEYIVPAVDMPTIYTAIAYGELEDGTVVICCENPNDPPENTICDQDECDDVIVETEPCGGEGCTPGFWKNNGDKHGASAWCDLFSPSMRISDVFSLNDPLVIRGNGKRTITNPTLLQALGANGGGVNAMIRHGIAAMLNACSDCVNYPVNNPLQIIMMIEDALNGAPGAFTVNELHTMFAGYNEAGCPVNQHGQCVGVEDSI